MGLLSFDPRLLQQMQGMTGGTGAMMGQQASGAMQGMAGPMMQMGQQMMGAAQPQQQGPDPLQMQSLAFQQQRQMEEEMRRRRMMGGGG